MSNEPLLLAARCARSFIRCAAAERKAFDARQHFYALRERTSTLKIRRACRARPVRSLHYHSTPI
jgi:hypothetical protein